MSGIEQFPVSTVVGYDSTRGSRWLEATPIGDRFRGSLREREDGRVWALPFCSTPTLGRETRTQYEIPGSLTLEGVRLCALDNFLFGDMTIYNDAEWTFSVLVPV